MGNIDVAVIGAGPTGISMLKQLRDDGFHATLFERRSTVGGLWAYDAGHGWTTALRGDYIIRIGILARSRLTPGSQIHARISASIPVASLTTRCQTFQEYMQGYIDHFRLATHMVFNTSVKSVNRNLDDTKWIIQLENVDSSDLETREFDKIVFCHGYQTERNMPTFPGQDEFQGEILHSQQYRKPDDYKGKTVVLVGLATTTADIAPEIISQAQKVYVSHRRGQMVIRRYRNGRPTDLLISWRRRVINQWVMRHFPTLHRNMANWGARLLGSRLAGVQIDPNWRLKPFPNVTLRLGGIIEDCLPHLKDGSLTSLHGIKRFLGGRSIEFDDGTVLSDVDAVIFTTGYRADFSIAPFIEASLPTAHNYQGQPIRRLYMNVFPPKFADSCAMLCYSAFGRNNGFSFSDVMSMAVSNVWRGVSKLPTYDDMEKWVDHHQNWVARNWTMELNLDVSMVKQYEFQPWMHLQAGTGMENLGWGLAGWKFWWQDRKMYSMMANGVETAHMFRYFETGKRQTWEGAREAIIHQNKVIEETFSSK
ncbi:Fc.00g054910.m01.CDS01 [Cosmosporella sp. VM-42]